MGEERASEQRQGAVGVPDGAARDMQAHAGAGREVPGAQERWGLGLQALAIVWACWCLLLDAGVYAPVLIGVVGAYVGRNPLRHVSAAAAGFAVVFTLAPAAYMTVGGDVWPGSAVLGLAVAGPRVSLAVVAVCAAVGLVWWAVAQRRKR